jgi:hypothetical protein
MFMFRLSPIGKALAERGGFKILLAPAMPGNAAFDRLAQYVRMATVMRTLSYFLEAMKRKESLPFR